MKNLPLEQIAEILGAKTPGNAAGFLASSVETDGDKAGANALLFDLHRRRYPDLSLPVFPHARPVAVVTDRPSSWNTAGEGVFLLEVADSGEAYWKFVDFYRSLFDIPVVGVTGTCGKTTTKEIIRHLLETKYRVVSTYRSINARRHNFGYLLELDDKTEAAVFEMGVAVPGDMHVTSRYFRPKIGVFTNIGVDHLAAFRNLDDYREEKGYLLEAVGPNGTAVFNADDEGVKKLDISRCKGRIIRYGRSSAADYRIGNIRAAGRGMLFTLRAGGRAYDCFLPLPGLFNVYNAAAALAAANAAGVELSRAVARLGSFRNVEKHFELRPGLSGSTVIDDTWSSNPTSAAAALELLKSTAHGRKTVAVLGRMSLLGRQSADWHRAVGAKAAQLGVDRLVVLGTDAKAIREGALSAGMKPEDAVVCANIGEAFGVLRKLLGPDTVVLVKTTMLASYGDLMRRILRSGEIS